MQQVKSAHNMGYYNRQTSEWQSSSKQQLAQAIIFKNLDGVSTFYSCQKRKFAKIKKKKKKSKLKHGGESSYRMFLYNYTREKEFKKNKREREAYIMPLCRRAIHTLYADADHMLFAHRQFYYIHIASEL